MNTPEELYTHLRGLVTDPDAVFNMVRVKFPDWDPNAPSKPKRKWSKTKYIRKINGPDDEAICSSRVFANRIELGTAELSDALRAGKGQDKFTWFSGYTYHEQEAARYPMAAKSIAAREEALARAVSRDPCPLCGVRGDVGCKHR